MFVSQAKHSPEGTTGMLAGMLRSLIGAAKKVQRGGVLCNVATFDLRQKMPFAVNTTKTCCRGSRWAVELPLRALAPVPTVSVALAVALRTGSAQTEKSRKVQD